MIKPRANLYSVEAEKLVEVVSEYKALRITQLLRLYPERQDTVRELLNYFDSGGRLFIDKASGRIGCNREWAKKGNLPCELAFWVLLDFYDKVEFHLPGTQGATITAYTDTSEYDLVTILPGSEQATSGLLRRHRDALAENLFVVLQNRDQIPLLHIPQVNAYCVVDENGTTSYFTLPKGGQDVSERVQPPAE